MESRNRVKRNGYTEIASAIKAEILSGSVAVGQFFGTERDLQEHYNASRSTIRKVLSLLVQEGFAVSIPNKGVFAGRGLAPNPSKKIAFIENGTLVQNLLFQYCSETLMKEGYSLERVGGTNDYPLEYALEQVSSGDYAGALVWGFLAFPDPFLVRSLTQRIPIVALDHRLGNAETDVVGFDHFKVAYELTSHLIRQGRTRIGLTGMIDTMNSTMLRMHGYLQAMFDNRLQPNPDDFVFVCTSGMSDVTTKGFERLLRGPDRPDALVILHDFCSPAITETILRCGFRIPEDITLGAIGDDFHVQVNDRGMTSIAFDWRELASAASELLFERLNNLQQPAIVKTIGHSLKVRGLCGSNEFSSYHSIERENSILPFHSFTSSWTVDSTIPLSTVKRLNQ